MKRTAFYLAFVVVFLSGIHQSTFSQSLHWVNGYLSQADVNVDDVTTDSASNIYTVGTIDKITDFTSGNGTVVITPDTALALQTYITKTNPAGNLLWAKLIETGQTYVTNIRTDNSGNLFLAGRFRDTVDFDPGAGVTTLMANYIDIFILKLDSSGAFQWVKQIGNYTADWISGMALDSQGNIIMTGEFRGSVDFDPGPGVFNLNAGSNTFTNGFVVKLDASGNFVWAANIGALNNDVCTAVATDASNNVIVTGNFRISTDLDPGLGTFTVNAVGQDDMFVVKLDANGGFVWGSVVSGALTEKSGNICTDASGGIYVSGQFDGTADFDPGPGTFLLTDINGGGVFIFKLNSNGQLSWAFNTGGYDSFAVFVDIDFPIITDAQGTLYAAYYFKNTFDFDPGPGTFNLTAMPANWQDAFILKVDSAGSFISARSYDGTGGRAEAEAICLNPAGHVIIAGRFWGVTDFDPPSLNIMSSTSWAGGYLAKFGPSLTSISEAPPGDNILLFPNPTKNTFTISFPPLQQHGEIVIYDVSGKIVLKQSYVESRQVEINGEGLLAGMYLVKCIFGDSVFQRRVVILE